MKKLSLFIITFALLILHPLLGMEQRQNEGEVSIAGLLKEDVLRALWVNASGTSDADTARAYALTTSLPCPTREEATRYLSGNSGGYFQGRKLGIYFNEDNTFRSYGYNKNHGPLRAEKVVQALREFPDKPIAKLYVSVFEEVNEAEQALMKELQQQGQTDKMLARYSSFSAIKDADCVATLLAMDLDTKQTKGAKEFAKGIAAHLNRDSKPTTTSAPNPSPAVSPKSSPAASLKEDEFPDKFKRDMGPGLRKMFGGKEPEKK
jgi:hypothetical protein